MREAFLLRIYSEWTEFTIKTNCCSLKWILSLSRSTGRLTCSMLRSSKYMFRLRECSRNTSAFRRHALTITIYSRRRKISNGWHTGALDIHKQQYQNTRQPNMYLFQTLREIKRELLIDSSMEQNLSTFLSMHAVQSVKWRHSKCVPQMQNLATIIAVSILWKLSVAKGKKSMLPISRETDCVGLEQPIKFGTTTGQMSVQYDGKHVLLAPHRIWHIQSRPTISKAANKTKPVPWHSMTSTNLDLSFILLCYHRHSWRLAEKRKL